MPSFLKSKPTVMLLKPYKLCSFQVNLDFHFKKTKIPNYNNKPCISKVTTTMLPYRRK